MPENAAPQATSLITMTSTFTPVALEHASRLIPERHTEDAYDTCVAEAVAAAADPAVFADGRWDFRADNAALHTPHHLGAGNFARASDVIRAQPLQSA